MGIPDAIMPGWENRIGGQGRAATRACDRMDAPLAPPRCAFCIAGAARSFASPLVLEALRANFLEPIAGSNFVTTGSRVFLSLKVADSSKRITGVAFDRHHSSIAPLQAALTSSTSWLAPALADAVIVNGSGSFAGSTPARSPFAGPMVVPADESVWRSFRASQCPPKNASALGGAGGPVGIRQPHLSARGRPGMLVNRSTVVLLEPGASIPTPPPSTCCRKSPYLLDGNNEERLIHQHLGLAWCSGAISRWERGFDVTGSSANDAGRRRRRSRFEVVVFARPDLLWWQPMPPWCQMGKLDVRKTMLACDKPGCDMVWAAPRRYMERLMGQATSNRPAPPRT